MGKKRSLGNMRARDRCKCDLRIFISEKVLIRDISSGNPRDNRFFVTAFVAVDNKMFYQNYPRRMPKSYEGEY